MEQPSPNAPEPPGAQQASAVGHCGAGGGAPVRQQGGDAGRGPSGSSRHGPVVWCVGLARRKAWGASSDRAPSSATGRQAGRQADRAAPQPAPTHRLAARLAGDPRGAAGARGVPGADNITGGLAHGQALGAALGEGGAGRAAGGLRAKHAVACGGAGFQLVGARAEGDEPGRVVESYASAGVRAWGARERGALPRRAASRRPRPLPPVPLRRPLRRLRS